MEIEAGENMTYYVGMEKRIDELTRFKDSDDASKVLENLTEAAELVQKHFNFYPLDD